MVRRPRRPLVELTRRELAHQGLTYTCNVMTSLAERVGRRVDTINLLV